MSTEPELGARTLTDLLPPSDLNVNRLGTSVMIWKGSEPSTRLDIQDIPELLGKLGFPSKLTDEAAQWAGAVVWANSKGGAHV